MTLHFDMLDSIRAMIDYAEATGMNEEQIIWYRLLEKVAKESDRPHRTAAANLVSRPSDLSPAEASGQTAVDTGLVGTDLFPGATQLWGDSEKAHLPSRPRLSLSIKLLPS